MVASLTNIDNKIYLASKFLLPSAAPEHPLSRYSTSWDEFDREYKVSLRQPVPRVLFPLFPTYAITKAADDTCLPCDGSSSVEDTPSSPLANEPDTPMSIEYENCAPTFTPANDLDLPESPVKAHLLERPGAPTPGRGRTQYVINEDSDEEENYSYVAGEDSGMDDVFGDGEASHTCDGSYVLPIPELLTPALSSTTTDSLVHGSIDAPDDMATLSAHVGQDPTTGIAQSSSAQQKSDIDLDEVFGQDATEFYEDEEDIVMSYASDLLARRTQGLLLSRFIPTGRKAYEALRAAFQFKEWTYDLRHAGLAAAEVAYYYSSEGLDGLRDNGFATRLYPIESERSIEWKSRQRDVAALAPYDPRSCKAEMLRYAVRKPERSMVSRVDPSSKHYNFLGQTVDIRSNTPATVSFLVQLSAAVKPYRNQLSRVGVILSQANKYIDAVIYDGPPELLSYRGTALQEQTTGYVSKLNDCEGSFGDLFDGNTIIKDFQEICDHFLANGWHVNMQRPCIMDYEEQAHQGDRDLVFNEPAPREFFRKRNAQGVIEHWCLPGATKPEDRFSKLWKVQSVDHEGPDGPLNLGEVGDVTGDGRKNSLMVVGAGENTAPPSSQTIQVTDSGHTSEDHEISNMEAQSEPEVASVEEYDPLNPAIPGLYRIADDRHAEVEEASQGLLHCVTNLLEQAACDQDIQQHSGDSSSEQDSDEEKQLGRSITPPSPVSPVTGHFPLSFDGVYSSALSCSKFAVVDTPLCKPGAPKITNRTIDSESVYSSALSFSNVVPIIDTPPCISGTIKPKPVQPIKCDEQPPTQLNPPTTTNPPPTPLADPTTAEKEEEEDGLSRYAFGYGILMFSIGIVLSMW